MSDNPHDELPGSLLELRSRPLFVMRLAVRPILDVGPAPATHRRIGVVPSGAFAGDRLSGVVLDGGSDWQTVGRDGSVFLDARLVLQAQDGAIIAMTYRGVRHGAPDVLARLDRGEPVAPSDYCFRISPFFETSDARHDWLNRVVAVGIGHRLPTGPVYSLFEIL
jgi:hypothetical protein